jgi:hypothetical protein
MSNVAVFQIFYNDDSYRSLDRGFIPLDNRQSSRPDWYELWPMLNFLNRERLDSDCWYGFLSPKFFTKTNFSSDEVKKRLALLDSSYEVALFSSYTDEIAIYQNVFEQGERWHPGLLDDGRRLVECLGCDYNVEAAVGTLSNSVFSNYVIAKAAYWETWHDLARRFVDICESDNAFNRGVRHNGRSIPVRVFLQERLSSIILSSTSFKTYVPTENLLFERFPEVPRRILTRCEELKHKYIYSHEIKYMIEFKAFRSRQIRGVFPFG